MLQNATPKNGDGSGGIEPGKSQLDPHRELIAAMLQAGISQTHIGKFLGACCETEVSPAALSRYIDRHGLKPSEKLESELRAEVQNSIAELSVQWKADIAQLSTTVRSENDAHTKQLAALSVVPADLRRISDALKQSQERERKLVETRPTWQPQRGPDGWPGWLSQTARRALDTIWPWFVALTVLLLGAFYAGRRSAPIPPPAPVVASDAPSPEPARKPAPKHALKSKGEAHGSDVPGH
jgi:predicted transcriptional regulator